MDLQLLAAQLRKPEGVVGKQIGEVMNNGNLILNQWTIAALDLQDDDYVLEIGMGNGLFVKDIVSAKPLIRYEGLDYSQTMIDEASKINSTLVQDNKARFTLGTAGNMPFQDQSFSKIFTINTIYFWENPQH
jgi:ubiquinone/menaquinone biosynthesis C-methylase UbiE